MRKNYVAKYRTMQSNLDPAVDKVVDPKDTVIIASSDLYCHAVPELSGNF